MKDIAKLALILTIVSAVSAAALSATYLLTSPKIEAEKEKAKRLAIKEVLPRGGKAVSVAPKGYSGPIEMLVGIDNRGVVSGVKILNLTETPGLGLSATSQKFLSQFKGKTKEDKLKAKYDIQAITGATITSQAVCDGVKEAFKDI